MRMLVLLLLCSCAAPAGAQSLFVTDGTRALDVSGSWTVGPASTGWEGAAAVSLNGRVDVGVGMGRYTVEFPGGSDRYTEVAPFARYYLFKEQEDASHASLSIQGQYFRSDAGWYGLAGATVSKALALGPALALHPFLTFAYGGESYTFGDGPAEREVYLTRQFGVHALVPAGARGWLRVTVDEQAFRRESYRAARVAYVTRF